MTAAEARTVTDLVETTRMLNEAGRGDGRAADVLMPLVYDELRALAAHAMQREPVGHTLQPTAIANEAYMRLVDQQRIDWKGRAHFFAVAAEMVRRILVDHARQRRSLKRGGNARREPLGLEVEGPTEADVTVLDLDEALRELAALDERQARVVELRYFGGLSVEETAHVLGVSPRTVKGDWAIARAWLRDRLDG
jgi:RNA polymerase sigma factor (TIGR02999 family)